MTERELIDIGINMTILVEAVMNKELDPEEVANVAMNFCVDMLKRYPKIKGIVEEKFTENWDEHIMWIKFNQQML
jgi:hypothetical protein